MKLGVAVSSALEALRANPLRSFLTMLGIIIGVASVMAMMAAVRVPQNVWMNKSPLLVHQT